MEKLNKKITDTMIVDSINKYLSLTAIIGVFGNSEKQDVVFETIVRSYFENIKNSDNRGIKTALDFEKGLEFGQLILEEIRKRQEK